MNLDIQTSSDPTMERLKKRRKASRNSQRVLMVAVSVAAISYLSVGSLMFGMRWLNQLSKYLYVGATLGAITGIGVVGYTIWVEIKAAVKGDEYAVWNAETAHSKPFTFSSYLRTKTAFAFLTIVSLSLFGALAASSLALIEDLKTQLARSSTIIAISVISACIAAAITKSVLNANSSNGH